MQATTAFIAMFSQLIAGHVPSNEAVRYPAVGERATCDAAGTVAGTTVVGEAVLELQGVGTVGTWVQTDLSGVHAIELYLDDRLLYALEVRYEEVIAVDEYVDVGQLSYLDASRVFGAFAYETVAIFENLSFQGNPVERASWCKVGCGAVGGAAGALVGAGAIAACMYFVNSPGGCRVVGATIGGAVAGAVKAGCEQVLCD